MAACNLSDISSSFLPFFFINIILGKFAFIILGFFFSFLGGENVGKVIPGGLQSCPLLAAVPEGFE